MQENTCAVMLEFFKPSQDSGGKGGTIPIRRRREKNDGSDNIADLRQMSHRYTANNFLAKRRVGEGWTRHGCVNPGWSDSIDANSAFREFNRHGLGHSFNRMLGHGINATPTQGNPAKL